MKNFSSIMMTAWRSFRKMINDNKQHYLFPCMIFCSREEFQVTTVLGSCISVCLYDPVTKIGGINHYMLALWNGIGLESPKYGNIAITKLLEKMLELGSRKNNLHAKVFGGAKVLEATQNSSINVGERNIEIAMDMLSEEHIPVVASSMGDLFGLKIIFNTVTGEILMKRVRRCKYEK